AHSRAPITSDMIASSLLILCLASIAESRVSFPFSEVLQRNDLLGGLTTFQCYAGCRVYSPNANDEIIILDKTGRVYYSLKQLSELKPGEYNDLPARPDPYTLKKTAADQGKDFVFYVIEKGAKNYDTRVYYVIDEETRTQAFREPLFTVLSTTGAIYMNFYGGTFEEGCPTVYATGFDSFSVCRPVYTARSAESVLNTAFPIYSPIATVDFKDSWGTKVSDVSGNPNGVITRGLNTTSVFTSPGYVGCGIDANTGGPARYYFDNNLIGFDSSFTVQSDYGMSVHITGDYSITTVNDEVTLTVNDIEETLNGTNHAYSLSYEPQFKRSPVQIGLKWQKQPFTQDSFAIQIDVIDKAPVIATTTTRPAQIIQTTVAPRPHQDQRKPRKQ
ncbi:hypothetical protein PMAYCL1PPCAC_00945, partial [Pristionchus mayeri]